MMRRSTILFSAGTVLGVVLGASAPSAEADGHDYLNACYRKGEAGKHEEAVDLCTRAINSGTLSTDELVTAYGNRMIGYRGLREFDKALADCSKALALNPNDMDVHFACANAYGGKGDYASAIQHADVVLKADPEDAIAHNNRGNFLNQTGDYTQALQAFETAIRLDAHYALARLNRGVALFNLGRFPEATKALEEAFTASPEDAYVLLWLTLARGRAGIAVSPESVLAAADDISRTDWPWPIVAYFGGKSIDFAEAVRMADTALEAGGTDTSDQDCEASFFYGEMAILRGKKAEAKARLQHAADTCPKTFIEHGGALAELSRF